MRVGDEGRLALCVTQAVTRARVAAMTVASDNCAHVSEETPADPRERIASWWIPAATTAEAAAKQRQS